MNVTNSRVRTSSNSRKRLRLEEWSPKIGESNKNRLSHYNPSRQPILPEKESTFPFLVLKGTFLVVDFPTCLHVKSTIVADPSTTTSAPLPSPLDTFVHDITPSTRLE
ncbi:hypothetical protein J1N35_007920 [Gossypium stocksii]|uniref:Uncharacterized protein n=1 Tax=Gossypium stocksii TaxID=47602 RepID=A0A9D3W8F3_9ROSI|nr:hypothetical protein J1N35_007920 [Gossypium stocksii]